MKTDNQELRNRIAKCNQVILRKLSMSDKSLCDYNNCRNRDIYSIFVGEYPRLSNLHYGCCPKHLSHFVDRAIADGKRQIAQQLREHTISEKKKAKQLLES